MATYQELEALLYFKGGAVPMRELESLLKVSTTEISELSLELKEALKGSGLALITEGNSLALSTAPEFASLIDGVRRDELEGPLGKAGLETLSIIVYRGMVSRGDIEYIRGVNSTAILRSLMIRGLIERIENPEDKRSFLYRATPELPAYLGVPSVKELPGYDDVRDGIDKIFKEREIETLQNEPS